MPTDDKAEQVLQNILHLSPLGDCFAERLVKLCLQGIIFR